MNVVAIAGEKRLSFYDLNSFNGRTWERDSIPAVSAWTLIYLWSLKPFGCHLQVKVNLSWLGLLLKMPL